MDEVNLHKLPGLSGYSFGILSMYILCHGLSNATFGFVQMDWLPPKENVRLGFR